MMGVYPLPYAIERDEISKFDLILQTYPISNKKIVLTKILETYLFMIGCLLLLSLPIVSIAVNGYHILTIQEGLLVLSISIIFSLIMIPINNAGFMMFGNKKGTIFYVVLLISLAVGYILLDFIVGIDQLLLVPLNSWLLFASILAIVLNILGYFACVKIYEIRHS